MIYSRRHRFLFAAVPKTASMSIRRILMSRYYRGRPYRADYHDRTVPPHCDNYFAFAAVRNPYAREVSFWRYRRSLGRNRDVRVMTRRMTFAEHLLHHTNPHSPLSARIGFPTQAEFLRPLRLDRVLRYETIADGFAALPFVAAAPPRLRRLPWHHRTSRRPDEWKTFYDATLAAVVYSWAREDFDVYGYDKDSWKAGDVNGVSAPGEAARL